MKTTRLLLPAFLLAFLASHLTLAQCSTCYKKQQVCVFVGGSNCPVLAGGGGKGTIKREAEVYLGLALQYMTPEQQAQFLKLPAATTQFINDNQATLKETTQQVRMTTVSNQKIMMQPAQRDMKALQRVNQNR